MVLLRAMGTAIGEAAVTSRSKTEPRTIKLPVQKLTTESFRPYGQVRLKAVISQHVPQVQDLLFVAKSSLAAGHLCK